MTANKHRKDKIRERMATSGANYTRAARNGASKDLHAQVSLSWMPDLNRDGVKASQSVDTFLDGDLPHLLMVCSNQSGTGPVVSSLIDQLSVNNDPSGVQFWMVEANRNLQQYENTPHVVRYMNSWSPLGEFASRTADVMGDAVLEMNRRHELMTNHPQSPKTLMKAREIAVQESREMQTPVTDHALYLPFTIVILDGIEDLIMLRLNGQQNGQQKMGSSLLEIVRKSRAAGIFLVVASQRSAARSLPLPIRNNTRIIDFS